MSKNGYTLPSMANGLNIALAIIGKVPGMVVDHINGNPFDNRFTNIRHIDHSANNHNTNKRKGVYFHKKKNKRVCQFRLRGEHIFECYDYEHLAVHRYKELKKKYYKKTFSFVHPPTKLVLTNDKVREYVVMPYNHIGFSTCINN